MPRLLCASMQFVFRPPVTDFHLVALNDTIREIVTLTCDARLAEDFKGCNYCKRSIEITSSVLKSATDNSYYHGRSSFPQFQFIKFLPRWIFVNFILRNRSLLNIFNEFGFKNRLKFLKRIGF